RVARSKCLAINPYFEYDFTSVSRGAVDRAQWELPIAHYVGRGFVSSTNEARWITRTRDYNIAQDGYEETDAGGAQVGWGAFTFRRPEHSYGDPVSGIVSNVPVLAVHQLPGTLEAELYDWSPVSGEGRTFHDTTPGNSGGEYRTDGDVDIETCSEGGYALADIEDGEWVSYTVNMMTSGVYGISVRYAAAEEVAVRVSLGGIDLTGDVMLPATGSSNVWNSCVISEHLSLPAGVQGLRIYFSNAADSYRFKSLTLTEGPAVAHPTIRIEAEDYVSQSGTVTEATSDAGGGSNIGSLSDGDWTMYGSYALGANASIRFRMARPSGKAVGRIEVRLGSSTGTLIGSMAMPETGGWQTWETYETDLDPVIGTQPLVLVFVEDEASTQGGDMMNLNWIELVIPAEPAAPNGLAASPVDRSRIALSWDSVERASQYNLKRGTTGGGPYSAIAIGPTVTQYTDSGLLAGTNYVYVISTTTDGVESDDSAEVSAVPSAPLNPGDVEIGTVEVVSDGNGGREFRVSVTASEPGHSYQVWTADRLVSPSWEPAGGVIPGNGAELEIDLPIIGSETNLFYKLEAWRQ
ncbi:carbohydrate-binding protein, partial [Pontiella sp.]|uniref:carbohydrate-binding protein n=1 Tax=Pontiella sp. TaxID=2837462 RepID=UPI003566E4C5